MGEKVPEDKLYYHHDVEVTSSALLGKFVIYKMLLVIRQSEEFRLFQQLLCFHLLLIPVMSSHKQVTILPSGDLSFSSHKIAGEAWFDEGKLNSAISTWHCVVILMSKDQITRIRRQRHLWVCTFNKTAILTKSLVCLTWELLIHCNSGRICISTVKLTTILVDTNYNCSS